MPPHVRRGEASQCLLDFSYLHLSPALPPPLLAHQPVRLTHASIPHATGEAGRPTSGGYALLAAAHGAAAVACFAAPTSVASLFFPGELSQKIMGSGCRRRMCDCALACASRCGCGPFYHPPSSHQQLRPAPTPPALAKAP